VGSKVREMSFSTNKHFLRTAQRYTLVFLKK
jgi:hypothetical protein